MLHVQIHDAGDRREVVVKGRHHTRRGTVDESRFSTQYSVELLRKTHEVTREFFYDDLERTEDPDYIERPLATFLERHAIDLTGRTVLDFGCGSGASAVIATRLGARRVAGIDMDPGRVAIARLRVRDLGLGQRIDVQHRPRTIPLAFADESFDVVLAQGVIEHIVPAERAAHLREMWRVVKRGGHLAILETPNRLWPHDGHTTGLWLVPWLPLPLACGLARRFSPLVHATDDDDTLVQKGIVGSTYWEIAAALKGRGANPSARERFDEAFPRQSRRRRLPIRLARRAFHGALRLVEGAVLAPRGVPVGALRPYLALAFEKA